MCAKGADKGTFRELFDEGYLDKRFNYDQPHERGYIPVLSRPFHGLFFYVSHPSDESLGYFQSSAKRGL